MKKTYFIPSFCKCKDSVDYLIILYNKVKKDQYIAYVGTIKIKNY